MNLRTLAGAEYNNAWYDPSFQLLGFGNGDGSLLANLGTDADVAAHELGHHLFETLAQPEIFSVTDPSLAMHEGFADTWAALVNKDPDIGESVLPGGPPLREIATNRSYPDDRYPDNPHETGLIYGSTNWDLIGQLGRTTFARILVAGMPFLPPEPEPLDYERALIQGDRALTGGTNEAAIEATTRTHGFDTTQDEAEYQGILDDGVTEQRALANGEFVYWTYGVPPGSTRVRFSTTGTQDVDLLVVGADFDPDDPSTYLFSESIGSTESITVTPATTPSVDEFGLGVFVLDYPFDARASSFNLTATATIGPVDLILGGSAGDGNLISLDQIDFFTFNANAGDYVRVDVTSLSDGLDLIAVVTDDTGQTVIDFDDDSGPGLDPLIQGAPIPTSGRYAIAVFAWFDDVNPQRSLGAYTVSVSDCANVGPDTDSNGVADACDGDDDGDGFNDDIDSAPLDPLRCFDIEADGCDDCSSGSFDPFMDGPDTDGDSVCDVGDVDDDADGCLDDVDPFPLTPSTDDDLDFFALDCDVCPLVPDPDQLDSDADGLGDACSSCNPEQWTTPSSLAPNQNPRDARIIFRRPTRPGVQAVKVIGEFNPAAPAAGIDFRAGSLLGAHVRLEDARGVLVDATLPSAGGPSCDPGDGWVVIDAFTEEYRNVSGALPPTCAPGSAQGLTKLQLYDTDRDLPLDPPAIGYEVRIDRATLPFQPSANAGGTRFTLAFGNPAGPGLASPEARAGWCSEMNAHAGGLACREVLRNGALQRIVCKNR